MKTAVYVRVSTSDQSTEMQLREITTFLAAKSITEFQIYQDEGLSASNPNRPGLKSLLDDCKAGKVEFLVVWRLDRLFRSLSHLLSSLNTFAAQNITFASVRDNLDMSTPSGRLHFHIIGAFAEFERELTVQRTLAGLANARAKGVKLGRPLELTQDAIDNILALRAAGRGVRAIGRDLGLDYSKVRRFLSKTAA